jgi:dTDP-4-dehydrorhamnose 3,5-epimerase
MLVTSLKIDGLLLLTREEIGDSRGFFARTFCKRELEAAGFSVDVVQQNVSQNVRRGTIRGLHFQEPPHAEAKIVRCTRGAIYDVVVDLRLGSATHGQWVSLELTDSSRALAIPEGFAHGFQTLEDDTEVSYDMGNYYVPEAVRGIRYDDPKLAIPWPIADTTVSDRDRALPGL